MPLILLIFQRLDKSWLFGVIEGGHMEDERIKCAKEVAQRPVDGIYFALELHMY